MSPFATTRLAVKDQLAVVEKHFFPSAPALAEYERRWLSLAPSHLTPTVVSAPGGSPAALATLYLGPHTLATRAPKGQTAIEVMVALCLVVANVHRHGLVHGNLDLNHVLWPRTSEGTISLVLCSPKPADGFHTDVAGLSLVARQMASLWSLDQAADSPQRWCRSWNELSCRIGDDQTMSALRAASAFGRLEQELQSTKLNRRWFSAYGHRRANQTKGDEAIDGFVDFNPQDAGHGSQIVLSNR